MAEWEPGMAASPSMSCKASAMALKINKYCACKKNCSDVTSSEGWASGAGYSPVKAGLRLGIHPMAKQARGK